MPVLSIVLAAVQWLILIIFLLIGVFSGTRRGFKKTYFYVVTNLLLTIGVLFLITTATIRWIFPTAGALVEFASKYLSLDQNTMDYLTNPNISPVIFALIDVVFKILLFIVVYPIVKLLFNLLVVKPLWYLFFRGNKEKVNKKVYREYGVVVNEKRHISKSSRFLGGLIGGVKGLVVGIVVLLPLVIISGIFNQTPTNNNNNQQITNPHELIILQNSLETEVSPIESSREILNIFKDFNRFGPGRFIKMVKDENGSIDEQIFDALFSGEVITTNELGVETSERLKLLKELNIFGSIASTIIDGGYLDDEEIDFNAINYEDDYENIDYILTSLGESQLINLAIPIALNILDDDGTFEEELGFKLKEINGSDLTFKNILDIKWNEEFKTISNIAGEALKIGNVGELIELTNNFDALLESDLNVKEGILNILEEITELQVLVAGNIAAEYALREPSVLNAIKWSDDPETYLRDRAQFIFNDHQFLSKELKTIHSIANNILTNHSDYQFDNVLVDGQVNFDYVLHEDTKNVFIETLTTVLDLELFKHGLPVGIDYAVSVSPLDVSEVARAKIDELIDEADYEAEINHLDSIYQRVINLGLSSLINNNQQLVTEIDNVMKQPEAFKNVKDIVQIIFVESEFVTEALDYGFSRAVNQLVTNPNIKDILLQIDEFEDFSIGQEIVNALNLAEDIYEVSDIQTILPLINNGEYLQLADELTELGSQDSKFKDNLLAFQIFNYLENDDLVTLANLAPGVARQITIPDGANGQTFKADLSIALDLAFETLNQAKINNIQLTNFREIDFTKVVDPDFFTQALTFNKADHEHSILLHTAVRQLQRLSVNVPEYGRVELSPLYKYTYQDPASDEWIDEVNTLISGAFDVIRGIKESDNDFEFTLTNINTLSNLSNIPIDLVYDLEESGSINKLGQSYNLKYNVTEAMTSERTNDIIAKALSDIFDKEITKVNLTLEDEWLDEDGFYSNDEIKELIKGAKLLNITSTANLQSQLLDNFFALNETELNDMFDSNYLRVMASRFLLSNTVREMLASNANLDVTEITFDIVERETELEDSNNMNKDEVVNVFVAFKVLGINDPANIAIDNSILKTLEDDEVDKVLTSNYFYQIVDLSLREQLEVPLSAEDTNGMIKKTEVKALIEALDILDASGNEIEVDNITVNQVEQLNALNSVIIDKLISDQVEEVVGVDNIPITSRDPVTNNITNAEIDNVLEAVKFITEETNPVINNLDMSSIKVSAVKNIIALESDILDTLITNEIEEMGNIEIPLSSRVNNDEEANITNAELANLILAIEIIDPTLVNLNDFEMKDLSTTQLEQLIALDSDIVDALISDQVKDNIDVPNASLEDNNDTDSNVKEEELGHLISAIRIVTGESDPLLNSIDMENTTITTLMLDDLLDLGSAPDYSPIITRIISEGIIDTIDSNTLTGLIVDEQNQVDPLGKDLERSEIVNLNESLKTLGFTEIKANINVDDITIVGLTTVTSSGYGTSTIFHRLISNSTKTVLGNDTLLALETNNEYIKLLELNKLFEGANDIGINIVSELTTFNFLLLEFDEIITADSRDSIIIRRLISKELIVNTHIVTDGFVENDGQADREVIFEDDLTDFLVAVDSLSGLNNIQDLVDELSSPNILTIQEWATSPAYNDSNIFKATIDAKLDELGY